MVSTGRIELPTLPCQRSVLPLYYAEMLFLQRHLFRGRLQLLEYNLWRNLVREVGFEPTMFTLRERFYRPLTHHRRALSRMKRSLTLPSDRERMHFVLAYATALPGCGNRVFRAAFPLCKVALYPTYIL